MYWKYKIKHVSEIYSQIGPGCSKIFILDNFCVSFRLFKIKQETIMCIKITGLHSLKISMLQKAKKS